MFKDLHQKSKQASYWENVPESSSLSSAPIANRQKTCSGSFSGILLLSSDNSHLVFLWQPLSSVLWLCESAKVYQEIVFRAGHESPVAPMRGNSGSLTGLFVRLLYLCSKVSGAVSWSFQSHCFNSWFRQCLTAHPLLYFSGTREIRVEFYLLKWECLTSY